MERMERRAVVVDTGEERTMHVVIGTDVADVEGLVAQVRAKALAAGAAVLYDGVRVWREREVLFDPKQQGSAAYQWDPSGDRVRAVLVEYVLRPGAVVERRVIRRVWVDYP